MDYDPERGLWVPGRRRFLFLGIAAAAWHAAGLSLPQAPDEPLWVALERQLWFGKVTFLCNPHQNPAILTRYFLR